MDHQYLFQLLQLRLLPLMVHLHTGPSLKFQYQQQQLLFTHMDLLLWKSR